MFQTEGIYLFAMIAVRFSGILSINPVFGRKGIPMTVKAGMVLALSLLVYSFTANTQTVIGPFTVLSFGLVLLKELLVGIALGFVFQAFFSVVQYVGTVIDFGMGISMATAWDPQSNVSVTINSNVLYLFMTALFFTTNCHLLFLEIILKSGQAAPYGSFSIPPELFSSMLAIFRDCMDMAVRMVFPMLAIQLLAEVGVGVLMKMIPQIDVFVVNIQLKIGIGMFLLLLMASPYGAFVKNLLEQMLGQLHTTLQYMK